MINIYREIEMMISGIGLTPERLMDEKISKYQNFVNYSK